MAEASIRKPAASDWGDYVSLGFAVYAVVFIGWVALRIGPAHQRGFISDLAFLPVNITAAVLALRAARVDATAGTAWRRAAVAFLAWWVGDVWWFVTEAVLGRPPFPSIADVGYLSFYPLLLWALFSFPAARQVHGERRRVWLDATTVAVAGLMAVWYLVVGPVTRAHNPSRLATLLNVAYPVGDLLLVFAVAALVLRGSARDLSLRVLLLGTCLLVAADIGYARLSLSDSYQGGDWPDAMWMAAQVLLLLSAQCHYRLDAHVRRGEDPQTRPSKVSVLPYLALTAGFGMLVGMAHGESSRPREGLVLGVAALTVLVMVRQISAIGESTRLLRARERELEETNRRLAQANEQLSQANEAKTAFLTTITHELQTPITSIRGISALLHDKVLRTSAAAEYTHRIARNADTLARLVADLAEFSRLGRGEISLAADSVPLSSLVPSVVDQLAALATQHRVRLAVQPDVIVTADSNAITRILTNLFGNAVKFSPPGTEIVVAVGADADMGVLAVMDEGPGVDEADRERLFELFYRGSRPREGQPRGMGIGLTVVRELTERMAGSVDVVNRNQGGARFTVRLPLTPPQP
jgi:signal transduction histidine kinase